MDFKIFDESLAVVCGGSANKINFDVGTDTVVINRNKKGTIFIKVFGKSLQSLKLLTDIGAEIKGYHVIVSSDKKYNVPLLILNPLPAAKEAPPHGIE